VSAHNQIAFEPALPKQQYLCNPWFAVTDAATLLGGKHHETFACRIGHFVDHNRFCTGKITV
jgi:hypothetical protein